MFNNINENMNKMNELIMRVFATIYTIILVLSYIFAIESFNSCFTPICVMAVIMKLK